MSLLRTHGGGLLWSTCSKSVHYITRYPVVHDGAVVVSSGMPWHGHVRGSRCYSHDSSSIDVDKLSQLAQIGLRKEEKEELGPQIERIVDWFGQLQQVDVSGVPPAMRGGASRGEDTSWLRPDTPEPRDPQEIDSVLSQVPEGRLSDDGFVLIPKTEAS